MNQGEKKLVATLVEAIQDKKGKEIVVADFKNIKNVVCNYFVICQANTRNQIEAIARNIGEFTLKETNEKPFAVTGEENAIWIAIDYGNVMVHIFQPAARAFYDLEHLWADAELTRIPDIDAEQAAV